MDTFSEHLLDFAHEPSQTLGRQLGNVPTLSQSPNRSFISHRVLMGA
jgi:hypothetical protein